MFLTHRHRRATERDLARLADGTLSPGRRARVERVVAASSELQSRLRDERRVVAAVRAARGERAPLSLRLSTRAIVARSRRRPRVLVLATAAVLAALVVTISVVGGGQAGPTVAEAATVAVRPATASAPAPRDDDAALPLWAADVPFPYWQDRFGWRATGVRSDRVGGRTLTTVFYRRAGRQIAYSIAAGAPLPAGARTRAIDRNHLALSVMTSGPRVVVTWLRRGHTCVLSGAGVPLSELLRLASWRAHGELPY
jgi:hypothetical protein